MDERTTQNIRKSSADAAAAAEGAGRAMQAAALAKATENAAKPGRRTSEFRTVLVGAGAAALMTTLQTLAIIPGPWMAPAAILAAAILGGSYAASRGNVKGAAIAAAAAGAAQAWPGSKAAIAIGAAIAAGAQAQANDNKPSDD